MIKGIDFYGNKTTPDQILFNRIDIGWRTLDWDGYPNRDFLAAQYSQAWQEKAFEQSNLPEDVKTYFASQLKDIPGSRLLLINKPGRPSRKIHFFVVHCTEKKPYFLSYELESYHDLPDLDLTGLLLPGTEAGTSSQNENLFLVCANGKRDPCCAKYGIGVYSEIERLAGPSAWQCTHVGGHRFAANLLCFPHGLLYGRVREAIAGRIVEEYHSGRIVLEHLRGRSSFSGFEQAAEIFLRQQLQSNEIAAFTLEGCQPISEQTQEVVFRSANGGRAYRLQVSDEATQTLIQESCRSENLTPMRQYKLDALTVIEKG